ncbi:MAG: class I SAM-dependent methyltransferase [Oscillospiraceae bacterium]|jgi:ubiquinone/menaquinone biosynthesis C-methylase UbiE|nr:class I SAM-dependent methyltransferase [Oscillospiraceae bacterium]
MSNTYDTAANFYDLGYQYQGDVPFFQRYAQNGPVLELACGTGRASIPLAESGLRVHGLDLSPSMLQAFRAKLTKLPEDVRQRITITQGNMASFDLGEKFPLIIIPCRAFQALTEDADITGCLQAAKNHLAKDGRFIVNCFVPKKRMRHWCYPVRIDWQRDGVTCKSLGERVDTKRQIIYVVMIYEHGENQRIEEPLELRYYYPRQLRKLLRDAGFRIVERYGDYDDGKIKRHGGEQIYVCEVAQ